MGNLQTTLRACQSALTALTRARRLHTSGGGPVSGPYPLGLISAYCRSTTDAPTMVREATALETNEFMNVDPELYIRFVRTSWYLFKCWPGSPSCRDDGNHLLQCPRVCLVQPLPPQILPEGHRLRHANRVVSAAGVHFPAEMLAGWRATVERLQNGG